MAMREYQKHEEANGSPTPSISSPAPRLIIRISCRHSFLPGVAEKHTVAKDVLAGLARGEADKLMETHGENFYDHEKMRYDAREQAYRRYGVNQGGNQGGDSGYQQGGGDSGNY